MLLSCCSRNVHAGAHTSQTKTMANISKRFSGYFFCSLMLSLVLRFRFPIRRPLYTCYAIHNNRAVCSFISNTMLIDVTWGGLLHVNVNVIMCRHITHSHTMRIRFIEQNSLVDHNDEDVDGKISNIAAVCVTCLMLRRECLANCVDVERRFSADYRWLGLRCHSRKFIISFSLFFCFIRFVARWAVRRIKSCQVHFNLSSGC